MSALLYRIGSFAARRFLVVIGIWIVVLLGAGSLAGSLGSHLQSSFAIPGTESQVALDMLDDRFREASGASIRVIFESSDASPVSAHTQAIEDSVAKLAKLDHVATVADPFADGNSAQIAGNGTMAFATVQYDVTATDLTEEDFAAVEDAGRAAESDALTVSFSGLTAAAEAGVDFTELIGLLIAFVVLIVTFGSLLAAGMPLVTAIIGVGISASLITIASNFMTLSSTAPLLATMLGLAVGIDYALFIVDRHRSQLAGGMDPKHSIATATATAGSAVVFAGLTVIIALLGLFVAGIPFLAVMGVGAAVAVLVAVAVAVTLVPAVLGLFGRRLTPKATSRAARRQRGEKTTLGTRWVRLVTAKPIVTIVVSVLGLLLLAAPALSMRLTLPDAGYDPPGSVSRVGYDTLTAGFGPGFNGPLLVAADISHTDVTKLEDTLDALGAAFAGEDGVASASPAIPNATLDMAIVQVTPTTGPDAPETAELVQRLRAESAAFEAEHGFSYSITGQTAMGIDISDRLEDALVPFAIVVVGLCMVLLTMVFRSLAVPITATLGFLLSVGAALGVTTAIFEWGWLAGPLGVAKVGPVISFMPILVMAVLFGLAMDYEVFLVSRMREKFSRTGNPNVAVRDGFTGSARVVTAAALIMFSVFASFVPGGAATIQPLAFALAIGVAVDAFIVRMTLIPALMSLLGRHSWTLPKWLNDRIPDIDIEGEGIHARESALGWAGRTHPDAVVAAHRLSVAGGRPVDLALKPGDVALISGAFAPLLLASIAGRAASNGMLVVNGHAMPADAGHVRRAATLVLADPTASSGTTAKGTVHSAVRRQLRLDGVRPGAAGRARVKDAMRHLAPLAGLPLTRFTAGRPIDDLTGDEAWLVEVAVAVAGEPAVLAVDVRRWPVDTARELLGGLAGLCPDHTVLVAAVWPGLDAVETWRGVHRIEVDTHAEEADLAELLEKAETV